MQTQKISLAGMKEKLSRDEMKSIKGGSDTSSKCFICEAGFGRRECIDFVEGSIQHYCKDRYGTSYQFTYIECAPGECEI